MALEDTAHQLFGTVPEVLAGLVAIIAAFAMFRLGGLQRRIEELGDGVLTAAAVPDSIIGRVRAAFAEHRRHVIKQELDRLTPNVAAENRDRFDQSVVRLDAALLYRRRLIRALTLCLWTNVATVIAGVIALALTQPIIAAGPVISYLVIGAVVAGLVVSVGTNTRVLYTLLAPGA